MPKTILTDIIEQLNEMEGIKRKQKKWTSTNEILETIKRRLEITTEEEKEIKLPLIIVIHSMDVGVLKGQEW